VPNGIPLRKLIFEYAGGMRDGQGIKAFAPSGPSGGFLPDRLPESSLPKDFAKKLPQQLAAKIFPPGSSHLDVLDLPLDLQLFRDLTLMLGAGLVIYGTHTDVVDQARNSLEFYRNESCGKCVPCRIGSQKLVDTANDLLGSKLDDSMWKEREGLIKELARTMELTSICGLGAVAANPLITLARHFRENMEKYLRRASKPDEVTASSKEEGIP
jgi:NADH:ubiquinone oxidoreductase subunit F (NADH-binding)